MILLWLVKAKANLYILTDVEGRRLGEQVGLDTLLVQAENDECHRLYIWFFLNKRYLYSINNSVSTPPQE
jgi:hypothetical protein